MKNTKIMKMKKDLFIIAVALAALTGVAMTAQADGWYESFETSSIDRNDYGAKNQGGVKGSLAEADNMELSDIFSEAVVVTGSPDGGGAVEPAAVSNGSP